MDAMMMNKLGEGGKPGFSRHKILKQNTSISDVRESVMSKLFWSLNGNSLRVCSRCEDYKSCDTAVLKDNYSRKL